ncbi:hypothetical protein ACJX0J_011049, partial [Zea mays]
IIIWFILSGPFGSGVFFSYFFYNAGLFWLCCITFTYTKNVGLRVLKNHFQSIFYLSVFEKNQLFELQLILYVFHLYIATSDLSLPCTMT